MTHTSAWTTDIHTPGKQLRSVILSLEKSSSSAETSFFLVINATPAAFLALARPRLSACVPGAASTSCNTERPKTNFIPGECGLESGRVGEKKAATHTKYPLRFYGLILRARTNCPSFAGMHLIWLQAGGSFELPTKDCLLSSRQQPSNGAINAIYTDGVEIAAQSPVTA